LFILYNERRMTWIDLRMELESGGNVILPFGERSRTSLEAPISEIMTAMGTITDYLNTQLCPTKRAKGNLIVRFQTSVPRNISRLLTLPVN